MQTAHDAGNRHAIIRRLVFSPMVQHSGLSLLTAGDCGSQSLVVCLDSVLTAAAALSAATSRESETIEQLRDCGARPACLSAPPAHALCGAPLICCGEGIMCAKHGCQLLTSYTGRP